MTWVAVAPSPPPGIAGLGAAITQGLAALQAGLELVRAQAVAAALIATGAEQGAVDTVNQALRSVVETSNIALNGILDSTGVYALAIPIPKKGIARLVSDATSNSYNEEASGASDTGSNFLSYPVNAIITRASSSEQDRLRASRIMRLILNPPDLLLGGNAYFLRTISEALFDPRDQNRPKFEAGSTWAYTILMAGASDVSTILQTSGFFERLIGGGGNANHVGASRGLGRVVPRGVTATPSGREGYAIVAWDQVPASQTLQSYDRSTVLPTQYAVIRSSGLKARAAQNVTDLFSTRELRVGLTGKYGAQVLAVRDYDGIVSRYLDEGTLVEGVTYYYHVAFATRVAPSLPPIGQDPTTGNVTQVSPEAQPYVLGFDLLSSAAPYRRPTRREDYAASPLGTAPDWIRAPSVAALIPPLDRFLERIQEYLRTFEGAGATIASRNTAHIDFLNAEIARYAAKADEVTQQLEQVNVAFDTPAVGLYATIRNGSGPMSSFIDDLVTAFEDDSDDQRPPFLNGDEFVTGTILLAVGPDPAPILAALALMQAFFTAGNSDDPAVDGLLAVNSQLEAAEAALIAQLTGGTNSLSNPPVTFNPNMTPRTPGSGDASCD